MNKDKKNLLILLFLVLFSFFISPVYSAYSTLDKVDISAPSSATVGQPVQVEATVYTRRTG
jgi:hypothetical protein